MYVMIDIEYYTKDKEGICEDEKMKEIFRPTKHIDVVKEAIELTENEPELSLTSAFSMILDAQCGEESIFKLSKSITSDKEMPYFVFVRQENESLRESFRRLLRNNIEEWRVRKRRRENDIH